MTYWSNEAILALGSVDEQERLERRRQSGEFWHRREVEHSLEKDKGEVPGLWTRVVAKTGDFLISFGQKLKEQGKADSPAAV